MTQSPVPVSWARRRALDAVMQWIRFRERGKPGPAGFEHEYVDHHGETTITGAGKVYSSEAVDRLEKLLVDTQVPQMLVLLRKLRCVYWPNGDTTVGHPKGDYCDGCKAGNLLAWLESGT